MDQRWPKPRHRKPRASKAAPVVDMGRAKGPAGCNATTIFLQRFWGFYEQIRILVAGFNPSENYWSIGMIIPNIYRKIKNAPNHQPGYLMIFGYIWIPFHTVCVTRWHWNQDTLWLHPGFAMEADGHCRLWNLIAPFLGLQRQLTHFRVESPQISHMSPWSTQICPILVLRSLSLLQSHCLLDNFVEIIPCLLLRQHVWLTNQHIDTVSNPTDSFKNNYWFQTAITLSEISLELLLDGWETLSSSLAPHFIGTLFGGILTPQVRSFYPSIHHWIGLYEITISIQ